MLNAKDKIIRAKTQMYRVSPFFSYLVLHLKPKEMREVGTLGVDQFSNLYYNPDFIEKRTDTDMLILLMHEVLHLALSHPLRTGKRNRFLWNIATDLVVNKIIEENDSDLFYSSIVSRDGITEKTLRKQFGIKISVKGKTAEEVYDELEKHLKSNQMFKAFVESYEFDKHFSIDDLSEEKKKELERKFGKPFSEIKKDLEREAKKMLAEAYNVAKLRGNEPKGMERIFDKLLESKMNWKSLLRKYVSDNIPFDFSWKRPSKKSITTGIYMPTTLKDKKLEMLAVVDLSGSISQEQMNEFMSEIYHISKSYRNVRIWLVTHDYVPQDFIEIKNGIIDRLLKIKLHGGGGTSHKWLPKYIKEREELRNVKLIVIFTDGYSDIEELSQEDFVGKKVIWIFNNQEVKAPFGEVIRL